MSSIPKCKRCRAPITLDESLKQLTDSAASVVAGALPSAGIGGALRDLVDETVVDEGVLARSQAMSVYASMMLQNSASVSASHASSPDSRPALRLTENANRRFLAEHFVRRGSDPHSQQSVLLSVPGGKQTCSGGAVDSQAPGTLPDLSEGVPPADLQEDNANHAETNAGAQRAPADSFIMLSSSQIPDSGPTVAPIPQPSSLRSRVKHYNASGPSGEGPDLPSGKRAGAEGDSRADKSSGVDGGARAESREEPSSRPKTRRARGGDGEAVVSAGKTFEINQQFRVINRLMDVLEERSELRHPLCVDCAERMLKLLESGAVKLEKERAMYEGYLQTPRAEMPTGEECEQLKTVLDKQLEYEQTLSESLRELDRQLEDAVRELERLDARHRELDGKEQRIWREYNEFENRMANFGDEQAGLERQHEQNVVQLGYLQQVNVYNDVFNIGSEGLIGTINGFRLGRLPSQPVGWSEINAAWGQALLLLTTVANKVGYTFQRYRPIPMGSYSRIERVEEDKASYELYGSGELHIGRIFHNRRFDQAMVAYLNCLQQLARVVEQYDTSLKLPYPIEHDRVGGVSIKLQFSNEETWTRALHHTLLNAKWVLAFASSFDPAAAAGRISDAADLD